MTQLKTVVRQAFWDDLRAAVAWYDTQQPGVGLELEEESIAILERIKDRPHSFAVWRGEVRRAPLRRFPYSAAFVIDTEAVFVVGLVHGMRDLTRWIDRRLDDE